MENKKNKKDAGKRKKCKQSVAAEVKPALCSTPIMSLTLCSFYLIRAARRRWDKLVCVSHTASVWPLWVMSLECKLGRKHAAPVQAPVNWNMWLETPPAESLAASVLQAKQPFLIVKCDPHGVRVQHSQRSPAKPWTTTMAE